MKDIVDISKKNLELIDTLWNVNMISVYQMGEVLGN